MRSAILTRFLLCLVLVLSFIAIITKAAKAEIATTQDWIGLFQNNGASNRNTSTCGTDGQTSCDSKAGTVFGTSWVYTSSCAKSPGPKPRIAYPDPSAPSFLTNHGCEFIFNNVLTNPSPLPSGSYRLRMYANDQETPGALIAESQTITTGGSSSPNTGTGQACPAQSLNPRVTKGLISAPENMGNFGNPSGQCVLDKDKSTFRPFELDNYESLKSKYYTQAKTTNSVEKITPPLGDNPNFGQFNSNMTNNKGTVFLVEGNLTVNNQNFPSTTANKPAIIFVKDTLTITTSITYPYGLVFIVQGDVYINKSITQIDAIIISQGNIYTAVDNNLTSCPSSGVTGNKLTIQGSLISLPGGSVVFCRNLTDNNTQAEEIIQQPKYLVILRDLLSDTLQRWSEVQ